MVNRFTLTASVSFRDGHRHRQDAPKRRHRQLYLRSDNTTCILFLVDRLKLETQAWRDFNAYLADDGINIVI